MQNENQVISKNSQSLQTKQNNSLAKYVASVEEKRFINAFENKVVLGKMYKDGIDNLIDTLAKWRWMSGINTYNQDDNEVARELVLLSKFVIKNYPQITIEEIDLAIDLSLTDKLDVDVRTFNSFSPMYVSRILNGYIEHRRKLYNDIYSRKVRVDEITEMEKKPTPKEQMDSTIDLIRHFYDKFKKDGFIDDVFNILYNYFRRTKKINPSKEVIDEAIKYGKIKSEEHINSYFADVLIKERPNKKQMENRYARNYCVCKFFENLNLEEFISKIEISEFE
jgi:hypothetical protein